MTAYVSVLSFDGIPFAERVTPSLSTISQPVEYQAKCIINGMLYLQDGIERPCDEKENEYLHLYNTIQSVALAMTVIIAFLAILYFYMTKNKHNQKAIAKPS